MRQFNEQMWAEEATVVFNQATRFFCRKREEKLGRLCQYIRIGSAHIQHGRVQNPEFMEKTLRKLESILHDPPYGYKPLGIRLFCPHFNTQKHHKKTDPEYVSSERFFS